MTSTNPMWPPQTPHVTPTDHRWPQQTPHHVNPTDLFNVAKELWPILGPYALLQVVKMDVSTFSLLFLPEAHFWADTRGPGAGHLHPQLLRGGARGPVLQQVWQLHKHVRWLLHDLCNTQVFWSKTIKLIHFLFRFLDLHLPRGSGKTYLYRNSYYVSNSTSH